MKALLPALIVATLAWPALPAAAEEDHDRIRRAVQSGEVLPLRKILDNVARDFPGDVIETELDDHHGTPTYEIKVISADGRVIKVYYDARDGSVLKVKGKRP